MLTWVGFSSLALMNIKEKCQNVYGSDRGNASASQRQLLPLQHDSAEECCPWPQQPHLLQMNLPWFKLSWKSTFPLCPCHREHLHTHPSATSVQVWLLPLNSSLAPGFSMTTTGRTAAESCPTLLREANRSPNGLPRRHLPDLCAGPGTETRKETEEKRFLFAARNQSPTSWAWGRAFLEQAMG